MGYVIEPWIILPVVRDTGCNPSGRDSTGSGPESHCHWLRLRIMRHGGGHHADLALYSVRSR